LSWKSKRGKKKKKKKKKGKKEEERSQKICIFIFFLNIKLEGVCYKRKKKIANSANMELKNVNPNSGNVVESNLNNHKFFILIVKIKFKNECHICYFYTRYHDCLQNKIPHIAHLTNQHWMNQSFICRYGFIPQEEEKLIIFWMFFGFLVAAQWSQIFA
jgi:hypothetical protein